MGHIINVGVLADVKVLPLLIALGFCLSRLVTATSAWRYILTVALPGKKICWGGVFMAQVVGRAGTAAPLHIGDACKVAVMSWNARCRYATVVSTLVVENLFGMILAAGFGVWAFVVGILPITPGSFTVLAPGWLRDPVVVAAVIFGCLALACLVTRLAAGWLKAAWKRFVQGFNVLRTPSLYVRGVLLWQLSDQLLQLVSIWFFLEAFGLHPTMYRVVLVLLATAVAGAIPLSVGGVGIKQVILAGLFTGQTSVATAATFSTGMDACILLGNALVLIVVLLAVGTRGFQWRDLPYASILFGRGTSEKGTS